MVVYSEMKKYIIGQYLDFKSKYGMKYVYTVGLFAVFVVLLSGGYFARQYFVHQRETRAFNGFREVTKSFQDAQKLVKDLTDQEKINERWEDVEILLDEVYNQNSGSYLAPYFLMYKAQIRLEKGEDVDSVYEDVDKALRMIPFDTPLYNLFLLKRIKMGLDSAKDSVRNSALEDLKDLAGASHRYMHEEAVYLLGLYQINNGELDAAQETWKALQDEKLDDVGYSVDSPWKKAVAEKVKSVS